MKKGGQMTQVEIAEMLGVTQGQISEIVNGKREISKNQAKNIKRKTGLSLDVILENDGRYVIDLIKQRIGANA